MNIKTITCHNVYNYGASLQAYALQQYLLSKNHAVEIIDFRPDFLQNRYNITFISKESKYYNLIQKYPFLKWLYGPLKNWRMFYTYGRKQKFDEFTHNYLNLTSTKYHNSNELKINPPLADLYIAGSDQIWNTSVSNGKEPAFYLDFGNSKTIRASYAASFGISQVNDDLKPFITDLISKLDFISVREISGHKILSELGFSNINVAVDPVFLLSNKQWNELAYKATINYNISEYILLYDFIGDKRIEQFAKLMSERYNLPIVSLNDFQKQHYADINISNAGPIEFLNLIQHSSYVISNSFHATAFSVIFEKEFYVFPLSNHSNSARMTNFVESLGISSRFAPTSIANETLNYNFISEKMSTLTAKSKSFLSMVLNSIV